MSVAEHGPLYQACPRCHRMRLLGDQCQEEEEWEAVKALHDLAGACPRCRGLGIELTANGLELFTLFKPHLRAILASLTKEGGDQ